MKADQPGGRMLPAVTEAFHFPGEHAGRHLVRLLVDQEELERLDGAKTALLGVAAEIVRRTDVQFVNLPDTGETRIGHLERLGQIALQDEEPAVDLVATMR